MKVSRHIFVRRDGDALWQEQEESRGDRAVHFFVSLAKTGFIVLKWTPTFRCGWFFSQNVGRRLSPDGMILVLMKDCFDVHRRWILGRFCPWVGKKAGRVEFLGDGHRLLW